MSSTVPFFNHPRLKFRPVILQAGPDVGDQSAVVKPAGL